MELDQKEREKENYLSQKENRLLNAVLPTTPSTSGAAVAQQLANVKLEKKSERKSSIDKTTGMAYSLGHMGVGSTAIAAAASQVKLNVIF